jgi:hypothetical protein
MKLEYLLNSQNKAFQNSVANEICTKKPNRKGFFVPKFKENLYMLGLPFFEYRKKVQSGSHEHIYDMCGHEQGMKTVRRTLPK